MVKPVFIVGLPRTGTTILHDILNQDPANRAPLTWELMFPSPPPEAAVGDDDPRVEACQAHDPDDDLQSELFKAMHPMGATLSQECVVMMGETMFTPLFHNQFRVPTYQDWVDNGADWSRRLRLPPPPAPAPLVAQAGRPVDAQDRRPHVGPRTSCWRPIPTPASCSPTATR